MSRMSELSVVTQYEHERQPGRGCVHERTFEYHGTLTHCPSCHRSVRRLGTETARRYQGASESERMKRRQGGQTPRSFTRRR